MPGITPYAPRQPLVERTTTDGRGGGAPLERATSSTPDGEFRATFGADYRERFDAWVRGERLGGPAVAEMLAVQPESRDRGPYVTAGREARDLGVAVSAAGGLLVPQAYADAISVAMKYASATRDLALHVTTSSGADMPWPSLDDTANVGVIGGEDVAITSLDVALTSVTMKSWAYESKLVRASWQLQQDSYFPLAETIGAELGERLGRIQNPHFATGDGTTQPQGFVTGGTVGVTLATGNTTSITYAGLLALWLSLDPAYRRHPSVAFQMSDTTWQAVLNIDSTQHPRFINTDGPLPTIFGAPVYPNNEMAAPAANARSIALAAWEKAYCVRDVAGVQLRVLRERFADALQLGIFAFLRTDGRIIQPRALRLLQQSAT